MLSSNLNGVLSRYPSSSKSLGLFEKMVTLTLAFKVILAFKLVQCLFATLKFTRLEFYTLELFNIDRQKLLTSLKLVTLTLLFKVKFVMKVQILF